MMSVPLPLVFDLHRYALDDGPGIRTTVFLKGCVLACIWCHNPESTTAQPAIAFHADRCLNCGDCYKACPENAIQLGPAPRILRDRCTACGKCSDVCPSTALRSIGRYIPPADLVRMLLADRVFYETSRGGVTFSGGEPTMHVDYLQDVLKALKRSSVHTAIETCGHFEYTEFAEKLLPFVDLIMFDLKLMDPAEHEQFTGHRNERILDNFQGLTRSVKSRMIPRVPLIPGITATRENLLATGHFLRRLGYAHCDVIPYDPGGRSKRLTLGLPALAKLPDTFMSRDEETAARELLIAGLQACHPPDSRSDFEERAG